MCMYLSASLSRYLDLERREERLSWEMAAVVRHYLQGGGQSWERPYPLESSDLIKMYNYLPYLNESIIWETVMGLGVASIVI